MSEYEAAELLLMQKSYVVDLELVTQGYVATLQTEANILLSMIFGYLMAAHFIGESLTKAQVSILNMLYLLTVVSSLTVYKGHYESIIFSLNRMIDEKSRLVTDIPIAGTTHGLQLVVGTYVLMIVASLYFMWSVRHPRP